MIKITTIYLIRHSKTEKTNSVLNNDSLQLQNEKQFLSIDGELLAEDKMNNSNLKNIDVLYSSNYLRALGTAKYIARNNNLIINIHEGFGERKFGVSNWNEIPEDFYDRQESDEYYKIGNGESQVEVRDRMYKSLMEVLEEDKNIAIVTHSTAMLFLLMKWCDITKEHISYNNKIIANTKVNNCDIFELIFNNNKNLIDIKKVSNA